MPDTLGCEYADCTASFFYVLTTKVYEEPSNRRAYQEGVIAPGA